MRESETGQNKIANHKVDHLYTTWQKIAEGFQTFEDLKSVKDKKEDIRVVQELLSDKRERKV